MVNFNEIIKAHSFRFSHKWGQNFISDTNLLKAIVADSLVTDNDTVLEIGAGAGALTYFLAEKAKNVVSYEIDESLREIHASTLATCNNVTVVYGDIMAVSLAEIEEKLGRFVLVANLPYYITTPIIFKFLESKCLTSLTIMVQKEVGERMVARHDTPDYGALSVSIQTKGNAKIVRSVSRNMFSPPPNVDSCIVRIDIARRDDIIDESVLSKLITSAFAMRRKTLVNNLTASFGMPRADAEAYLTQLNLDIRIRGEALSVEQFVSLANLIASK